MSEIKQAKVKYPWSDPEPAGQGYVITEVQGLVYGLSIVQANTADEPDEYQATLWGTSVSVDRLDPPEPIEVDMETFPTAAGARSWAEGRDLQDFAQSLLEDAEMSREPDDD